MKQLLTPLFVQRCSKCRRRADAVVLDRFLRCPGCAPGTQEKQERSRRPKKTEELPAL
jgi:hypothetical protein